MSLYKVFGCRAFVNISKQVRRKNLNARSTQGIFIGLDRRSYPGYMVYYQGSILHMCQEMLCFTKALDMMAHWHRLLLAR